MEGSEVVCEYKTYKCLKGTSLPKLCTSIRMLQKDAEYTASMYRDISAGIDRDRNRARREHKLAVNKRRLKMARAYDAEIPGKFFADMKKYTKLFE